MKHPGFKTPSNEEERKILRRYQAVRALIRGGRTEEEAIAHYDRPRGVCGGCGVKCSPNGRQCRACRKKANTEARREYWSLKKHWKNGTCRVCKAPFYGPPNRKNCDAHANARVKEIGRQCRVCLKPFVGHPERVNCDEHFNARPEANKKFTEKKPSSRQMIVLPGSTPNRKLDPTEVKPLEVARLEVARPIIEPRPEPVKVPPGFKVTVCPSVMPSRWD